MTFFLANVHFIIYIIVNILHIQRDKMIVIVPQCLRQTILNMNLVGRVLSLNHFQVEQFYEDHPMYQSYRIFFGDWAILIKINTIFTRLGNDVANSFPQYPLCSSITSLARDFSRQRMMIGTFIYLIIYILFLSIAYNKLKL